MSILIWTYKNNREDIINFSPEIWDLDKKRFTFVFKDKGSLDFLHLHDSSVQNFDFLNQRYLVELDQLFFPLEDTSHVADFLISSLETLVGLTEPH